MERRLTEWMLRAGVALLSIFSLAVCSDPPTGASSAASSAEAGSATFAALPAETANIGCAIGVQDARGVWHERVIPRSALPFKLASLTSARRTRKGTPLLALRSDSTSVWVDGSPRELVAVCIGSIQYAGGGINTALRNLGEKAKADLGALILGGDVFETSGGGAAFSLERVLMRRQGLVPTLRLTPLESARSLSMMGAGRGTLGGAQLLSAPPELTPITVYGTRSRGWVVSLSPMESLFEIHKPFAVSWMNSIVDQEACDDGNGYIDALQFEANRFDDKLADLQSGVTDLLSVSGVGCERQKDAAFAYCLDIYIQSCRVNVPGAALRGDCRDGNPNAKIDQSRAQIYVNPDQGKAYVYPSSTTIYGAAAYLLGGDSIYTAPASPNSVKRATISRPDSNHTIIEFELWNAVCVAIDAPGCLAIVGRFEFSRTPNGRWELGNTTDHTAFPSMDLYQLDGSSWQRMYHSQEGHWWELRPETAAPQAIRDKLNEGYSLPPGCSRA